MNEFVSNNSLSDCHQELPSRRTGLFIDFFSRRNIVFILLFGLLIYISIVFLFSIIELLITMGGVVCVQNSLKMPVTGFFDILYFNFVTTLTVGYGEFVPIGIARIFSILEAIMGVGLFSIILALFMSKILLPADNTIVFSKYAYYSIEDQKFLIIFVNTSRRNLVNVQISSFYKLGGKWGVKPCVTSPFITTSVQTFFIEQCNEADIIDNLDYDRDCLRVGIAGDLGYTRYSTCIEYGIDEIIVIDDRKELLKYKGFIKPNLKQEPSREMFHYRPEEAKTLKVYVMEHKDFKVK